MRYSTHYIRAENPITERIKTCADMTKVKEEGREAKHRVVSK